MSMGPTQQLNCLFLQGGSVAKRLRGVNSRFKSGGGGLDSSVALYALAILISVLAVIVIRRIVLWRRWNRIAGEEGLGLSRSALKLWWKYLSVELRQDPNKIFDSRERMSCELERLVDADEEELAKLIHQCWIRKKAEIRHPLSGQDNLLQTETVLVRDEDNKIILSGFLRRIGTDAVDVVPFRKTTIKEIGVGTTLVDLERARGCDSVFARILKTSSDGRLWTFSIGDAAKVEHQRLEFRIQIVLGGLVFDKRLKTLEEVQEEIDGTSKPTHHLLAKQQRENRVTIADLMKRKKLFYCSRLCHLIDLSAMGARLRIVDNEENLTAGKSIFLYLPFHVGGQQEEYLIEAEVVETWSEPTTDPEQEDRILRLRFFNLEPAELQSLRRLVNVINATPIQSMSSDAQELHEEFLYKPVS